MYGASTTSGPASATGGWFTVQRLPSQFPLQHCAYVEQTSATSRQAAAGVAGVTQAAALQSRKPEQSVVVRQAPPSSGFGAHSPETQP